MNWLNIHLKFVENIIGDTITANKVSLLVNNFWNSFHENLYMVKVSLKDEEGNIYQSELTKNTCYSLKYENSYFAVLKDSITEGLNSVNDSLCSEGVLLKIDFLTSDKPINDRRDFKILGAKRKIQTTYKLIKKTSDNNVLSLKNDGIDFRKLHIKEMFNEFVKMKLIKLYKNINVLDSNKIFRNLDTKGVDKLDLYFFTKYSECIDNLKDFIKNLSCFNLIKDEIKICPLKKHDFDEKAMLEVSKFKYLLKDKLKMKLKREGYYIIKATQKRLKFLFNECCDHFVIKFLNDEILLPVDKVCNLEYYLNKIFDLVYKATELHRQKLDNIDQEEKKIIKDKMINWLDQGIQKLQLDSVKQLCTSVYFNKHFSQLLERELKTLNDYKIYEKIICDYSNMLVYIVNWANKLYDPSSDVLNYRKPLLTDNHRCKIINGIEIKFMYPVKLEQIKAFDREKNNISFIQNVDYFIDNLGSVYCISNILRMKNVYKIEVISSDKSFKKFRVNDYLTE